MTECRTGNGLFSRLGTKHGFSMAELLVVMGIFVIVIMISSDAFEKIAKSASKLIKSSDSNIQGIVGLEVFRSDLASAGFGLPWTAPGSAYVFDFAESTVTADSLAKGIDPADFNDVNIPLSVDPNRTPRAVQSAAAGSPASDWEIGRDYLVIKSTAIGKNTVAKKWTYLEGLAATSALKEWGSPDDLVAGDRVITLKTATVNKKPYRDLVVDTANATFSYVVPAKSGGIFTPPQAYRADTADIFLVYGVNASSTSISFPYNRVDYYIKRPTLAKDIPARCAPGTGILYRAVLNQTDGKTIPDPLLDCVADMQVVFSLDTDGDGGVDLWFDDADLAALSAEEIRAQLREIRLYILAQDGQKDTGYSFTPPPGPPSSPTCTTCVQVGGPNAHGRAYDLSQLDGIGSSWQNYRWKVYTIVVEPKNINN